MLSERPKGLRLAILGVALLPVLAACGTSSPTPTPSSAASSAATPASTEAASAAAPSAGASSAAGSEAPASAAAAPSGGVAQGGGVKNYKIALTVPLNVALFQTEVQGAQAAAALDGVTLNVTYLQNYAEAAYISQIETAIATKPDGLIMGFYSSGYTKVTDEAESAGIKVVFVNGGPLNQEPDFSKQVTNAAHYLNIGFSGANEQQQSTALANAFLPSLPGSGTVLEINNAPGQPDHAIRIATAKAIFEAAGYKTDTLNGSQDTATAQANVSSYLAAHPGVVGAYTTGFNSAQAACAVAKQQNLKLPVATFDADPTSLQAIKDGCVTVLVDQQFFLEGFYAVTNLYHSLRWGTQPVIDNTGTFIVTKDNVDTYPTSFP